MPTKNSDQSNRSFFLGSLHSVITSIDRLNSNTMFLCKCVSSHIHTCPLSEFGDLQRMRSQFFRLMFIERNQSYLCEILKRIWDQCSHLFATSKFLIFPFRLFPYTLQCICKLFLSVLRKSGHEISETETRALNSFPFDVDCLSFL